MDEGSSSYNQDSYAPISIHDVYGRSDYNFGNNVRIFGLYQPNFFHEHWLHSFADGWSLGGTYEYHSGFPWTPTYPVTTNGQVTGTAGSLYYASSPYTSIRPAAYTGTGLEHTAPPRSNPDPRPVIPVPKNVNFPTGTEARTTSPRQPTPLPAQPSARHTDVPRAGPAMERNSFTGPCIKASMSAWPRIQHLPEARVIGDHAGLEFRVDAYNLFNLTRNSPVQLPALCPLPSARARARLARARSSCRRASRSKAIDSDGELRARHIVIAAFILQGLRCDAQLPYRRSAGKAVASAASAVVADSAPEITLSASIQQAARHHAARLHRAELRVGATRPSRFLLQAQ